MQLSAGVVCRALIMLLFLIGIPMAALSGSSWSEMVRRLQTKWQEYRDPAVAMFHSTVNSTFGTASSARPLSEAPRFDPIQNNVKMATSTQSPGNGRLATSNAQTQCSSEICSIPVTGADQNKSGVVPAGYAATIPDPNGQNAPLAERTGRAGETPGQSVADQYGQIQDRLRRLGATYYLLESWGNEPPLYRFYCKMAVAGNANYTRYFEATDANALQAMVLVLRQVETWREGGTAHAEAASPQQMPPQSAQ